MPQKFNYIDFSKEISSLPSKSASLSKDRYISRDFMAMEWDGIWTKHGFLQELRLILQR